MGFLISSLYQADSEMSSPLSYSPFPPLLLAIPQFFPHIHTKKKYRVSFSFAQFEMCH